MLSEELPSHPSSALSVKSKRKTVRVVPGQFHRRSSRNRAMHHRARNHRKHSAKQSTEDRAEAVSFRQLTNDQEREATSVQFRPEPMQVDGIESIDLQHSAVHNDLLLPNEEHQLIQDMSQSWQAQGTTKSFFDIVSFAKLSTVARLKFLRRSERYVC